MTTAPHRRGGAQSPAAVAAFAQSCTAGVRAARVDGLAIDAPGGVRERFAWFDEHGVASRRFDSSTHAVRADALSNPVKKTVPECRNPPLEQQSHRGKNGRRANRRPARGSSHH
ncbi:MAG: hypothetical protein J7507_03340 [Pseudoxanthomonas sp.]|nr:hypothetical protein [Pseudoxanthomonas sp.]